MLDAGTDNVHLRSDPWYLGMTHPRLSGDEYYSLVHEFVNSVHSRWPNAVLQFEDFSSDKVRGAEETVHTRHSGAELHRCDGGRDALSCTSVRPPHAS